VGRILPRYDKLGNLLWRSLPVTDQDPSGVPAQAKTQMTYLDPGWIRTSNNVVNPTVFFDYTAEGWQESRTPTKPSGGLDLTRQMRWDYAVDGALISRADREGNISRYLYNLDNDLIEARDSSGISDSTERVVQVLASYDWLGRPTLVKNRKSLTATFRRTTYAYDPNGNLAERTHNALEGSGTDLGRKSTFAYDEANVLDTQTILGDNQQTCTDDRFVDNQFTPNNWESSRRIFRGSGSAGSCAFTNLKQTTTWDYFANGKLKQLDTKDKDNVLLESHVVSYLDQGVYVNGFRTSDEFGLNPDNTVCQPGNDPTPCTALYAYDARDRLAGAYNGHGGRVAYTFDQPDDASRAYGVSPISLRAGNITTEETYTGASGLAGGTLAGTENSTYTGNQLTEQSVGGSVTEYHYDPNGNLDCITRADGSASTCPESDDDIHDAALLADYTYDGLDRLLAYRSFGETAHRASYTYDALDRLVKQVETHGTQPTASTTFDHLGLTNR
jgi:YD repeat-containing protein